AAALARNLAGDRRSKAVAIDGWTALNAYVPPKERRGLVLVDPAFEDASDFARLAQALAAAHRQRASGIFLALYPIQERDDPLRVGAPCAAERNGQYLPPLTPLPRPALGAATWRVRSHRHHPAVDARRRACNAAAGACACPVCGGRGQPPRQLACRRKVVSPLFHSLGLAYFLGAGFDVPPPVGARRSNGGRKAAAFPVCECPAEPPRRGGRRRSNHGERSFPMAMAGTVKFFNAERGYGFI